VGRPALAALDEALPKFLVFTASMSANSKFKVKSLQVKPIPDTGWNSKPEIRQ
jgi:hypothetical protein